MEQGWISQIQVITILDKDGKTAENEIRLNLNDRWKSAEGPLYLWARIEERKGKEVDAIFPLPLEDEMEFCMRIADPILWNAENAYCYRIILEIRNEAQEILNSTTEYAACYRFETVDGDSCLNGKKITYRSRKLPSSLITDSETEEYLRRMKREFCNSILIDGDQKTDFLVKSCNEYGIYLIAPAERLEYGKIKTELEQNPEGAHFDNNPDFTLEVIREGVLIENHSTFVNASEYRLVFEIRKDETLIQKGGIHADVPAGESRYVKLPYLELHDAGEFIYHVSLQLEEGTLWEEEGYEIAYGEKRFLNLFV